MVIGLTNALMRNLSVDIRSGKPTWAILKANEYLESQCPLRNALVRKARQSIKNRSLRATTTRNVLEKIFKGEKLANLSVKERDAVLSIDNKTRQSLPPASPWRPSAMPTPNHLTTPHSYARRTIARVASRN